MFPAFSIEDFMSLYEDNHQHVPRHGVWSFLLANSAMDDKVFCEHHFDNFNKHAGHDWHLVVFSKGEYDPESKTLVWTPSVAGHNVASGIRSRLTSAGITVPPLCILFSNPLRQFEKNRYVIVPLDSDRIKDVQLFIDGFKATAWAIRKGIREAGIGDDFSDPNRYEEFLENFEREIRKAGLQAKIFNVAIWIQRILSAARGDLGLIRDAKGLG
jgi:hypothetical protein